MQTCNHTNVMSHMCDVGCLLFPSRMKDSKLMNWGMCYVTTERSCVRLVRYMYQCMHACMCLCVYIHVWEVLRQNFDSLYCTVASTLFNSSTMYGLIFWKFTLTSSLSVFAFSLWLNQMSPLPYAHPRISTRTLTLHSESLLDVDIS